MPPLSHIIRFYTSVLGVSIANDPVLEEKGVYPSGFRWLDAPQPRYQVYPQGLQDPIGIVDLDAAWPGRGQPQTLTYISRWCLNFVVDEGSWGYKNRAAKVNVRLVESVDG